MIGKRVVLIIVLSMSSWGWSQTENSEVASIFITSWSKPFFETFKSVGIDSLGNVYVKRELQDFTVDIERFNEKLLNVLKSLEFHYSKANNNPPPEAMAPDDNKQAIDISIRLKEDRVNDQKFMMPAEFNLAYWNVAMDFTPIDFLDFFQESEAEKLRELIKRQ